MTLDLFDVVFANAEPVFVVKIYLLTNIIINSLIKNNAALASRINVTVHIQILNEVNWITPRVSNLTPSNTAQMPALEIIVIFYKISKSLNLNLFLLACRLKPLWVQLVICADARRNIMGEIVAPLIIPVFRIALSHRKRACLGVENRRVVNQVRYPPNQSDDGQNTNQDD